MDVQHHQQHEIVSGFSFESVEHLLISPENNDEKLTDQDIRDFVNGPQKMDVDNDFNCSAALFNDSDDDIIDIPSPVKFPTFGNKRQDKSPPRKVFIPDREQKNSSHDIISSFSSKPSKCESAVEKAKREIEEERQKKMEIAKKISEVNGPNSFRTAKQELFLKNSQNPTADASRAKYLGNKRFVPANSAFKIPIADEVVEEKTSSNNDDELHPLLKNIQPEILETIRNEVTVCTQKVSFDDIAGLKEAKKSIYEAVIMPLLRPELFKGLRTIPRGKSTI